MPVDTVADVRKRVGAEDRDPGGHGGDEQAAQARRLSEGTSAGAAVAESSDPVASGSSEGKPLAYSPVASGSSAMPSGGQRCGYGGRFQTHCSPA